MINKIDINKLNEYKENNLVHIAKSGDLIQINYTDKTMYNRLWDDITLNARGHIYNKRTGELVCPAMSKFFNYNELSVEEKEKLDKRTDYTVTKKYDGSLGIVYKYRGKIRYNSRGSFDGHVVKEIEKIVNKDKELKTKLEYLNEDISLNIEVISPATRVITNYGDTRELILITCFERNKEGWKELDFDRTKEIGQELGIKVIEEYKMNVEELIEWCKSHKDKNNEEGFVLRYSDNTRVKYKSIEWMQLNAVKSQLQEATLLNVALSFYMNPNISYEDKNVECNKILEEKVMSLPDELYEQGREEINKILNKRNKIFEEIEKEYIESKELDNKEVGISQYKYKDQIYSLRKGRIGEVERYIIKRIIKENKVN